MKKSKLLILCAVVMAGTLFATGCSRDGNMNDTQAPYEDETNKDVNDTTNNGTTNNGTTNNVGNDLERSGNNLQDAGRNLVDSVEDAGGAIMDGVRDITGTNNNNTNNR